MTEKYVQVPVSVLKEARSLLRDLAHRRSSEDVSVVEIKKTVYAALALLSQPTPTDMTNCTCDWHMTMRDPDPSCPVHSPKDTA